MKPCKPRPSPVEALHRRKRAARRANLPVQPVQPVVGDKFYLINHPQRGLRVVVTKVIDCNRIFCIPVTWRAARAPIIVDNGQLTRERV